MNNKSSPHTINVPADVPQKNIELYKENYNAITKNTSHLLLFSADQKIEHLHENFYGAGIPNEDTDPEHIFKIASQGSIGALDTHLGLISHYGKKYPGIHYIVKLNGKTNIIPSDKKDPMSQQLWSVHQVMEFKENTQLSIRGVGYTVYLGSEHESLMLWQAAQCIYQAHHYGLIAILWLYPRGTFVKNPFDGMLIAGAAGVAASLGADFVKLHAPKASNEKTSEEWLEIASQAAGHTKIICSGGAKIDEQNLIATVKQQMQKGKTAGIALGRNLHQRSLSQAIELTKKLSSLIYGA